MGGNIISALASLEPQLVRSLVYLGAFASGRQLKDMGLTASVFEQAVSDSGSRTAFISGLGVPPGIAQEAATWPLHAVLGNVATVLEADSETAMGALSSPALIIQSLDDPVTPLVPFGELMVQSLPQATLATVENAGHFAMLRQKDQVNALIREFALNGQADATYST